MTRAATDAAAGRDGFAIDRDGPVATLQLRREHAGNAIDRATGRRLDAALAGLEHDESLLCLVVAAAGQRFFCTGGDLNDYRELDTAQAGQDTSLLMQATLDRLERMSAITVAAINGVALGGGLELALACDLRVADERAELSLPQARLGVVPGWGGVHRLHRVVGRARAVRLLATAETVGADEAERIGLVDAVVPAGTARSAAEDLAGRIAANAPLAVRSVKPALAMRNDEEALAALFGTLWDSRDHREAERAYFQRRRPSWQGA